MSATKKEQQYDKLLQKLNVPHKLRPHLLVAKDHPHYYCKVCFEGAGKPCICYPAWLALSEQNAITEELGPLINHLQTEHHLDI